MSGARDRIRARDLPPAVGVIAARLHAAGHACYLVGGCLRDLARGAPPNDWDLATSARPDEVAALFARTVAAGERFGTLIVIVEGQEEQPVEVTTLRSEAGYSDRRHPDRVVFTDRIELDLERRDFTVNAMAVDLASGRWHDPAGGRADLERRLLRAVGDPARRFAEDALRLVRACRLAAELEFDIEAATARALAASAALVDAVASERVRDELMKLMQRARRASLAFVCMRVHGLLAHLLPELEEGVGVTQNRYHRHDVWTHMLATCDRAPRARPLLRLAALLHDVAKPRTREVGEDDEATFYGHDELGAEMVDAMLARLRFSNRARQLVTALVRHHMFQYGPEWSDAAVRRFIRRVGVDRLADLFALREADAAASGSDLGWGQLTAELRRRVEAELTPPTGGYPAKLAIGGREVMEVLGIGPGPEVGRWLARLDEAVLAEPRLNQPATLLALLTRWARADDGGEGDETDATGVPDEARDAGEGPPAGSGAGSRGGGGD